MQVRLIRKNGIMQLLCHDGSIAIADELILRQLFIAYKSATMIRGKDGKWSSSAKKMEDVSGTTLVWVDDNGVLCIDENPFVKFAHNITDNEYITAIEYAELNHKNVSRVKALLKEGRITGAMKKSGKWFIPKHAPYPDDARHSGIEK